MNFHRVFDDPAVATGHRNRHGNPALERRREHWGAFPVLNYTTCGKRSYLLASQFDDDRFRDEAPILKRLSDWSAATADMSEGAFANMKSRLRAAFRRRALLERGAVRFRSAACPARRRRQLCRRAARGSWFRR